jgi:hypothetical protein
MSKSDKSSWMMRAVLIVLAAVVVFFMISYFSAQSPKANPTVEEPEGFYEAHDSVKPISTMADNEKASAQVEAKMNSVAAAEPSSNDDFKAVDFEMKQRSADNQACFPRDKLTAEDLLPKDAANSKWAQVNPAGQGAVSNQNFLTAGFHVGVNTVGNTLRNANLQIRSEPPNPRSQVSPWNQSTIEYDSSRRYLEVGEC